MEDWKIKITVLWILYGMATFAENMIRNTESGTIEQVGPEVLLLGTIIVVATLTMAFLSLTLKDSVNRWANVIVGVFFFAIELFSTANAVANLSASTALISIAEVVIAGLIVWYAWKSKQKI